MFQIEIRHDGLNKYRLISGRDAWVVDQKATALKAQWNAEWARRVERDERQSSIYGGKFLAQSRTEEAEAAHASLTNMFESTLGSHELKWDALRLNTPFSEPMPAAPQLVSEPPPPMPPEPPTLPKATLVEIIIPALRRKTESEHASRLEAAQNKHQQQRNDWEADIVRIKDLNRKKHLYYDAKLGEWQAAAQAHEDKQTAHNAKLEAMATGIAIGAPDAVVDRLCLAFLLAKLPAPLGTDFEVGYSTQTKSAVIDYVLPAPSDMPVLKDVRYIQARNELVERNLSKAELGRLYDATLYRAALSILHIAFSSDPEGLIERVTLNGWVDHVVKATGLDDRTCVLTIGVNRADFLRIDMQRVDPKECFKALRGIAASKLVGLAAVAPLERPALEDSRFIQNKDVASAIDHAVNIAAMDWAEFEHLVRQVFENEFSTAGTEVRVTQASRDGGVDAIVHDPDPIRGGKIVIQAKRYTNTVDVSAVRDLYGTVVNEGASKGILVTTSQFGPDARKFAQGKPITLIDGGNFLHLLERMGVQARIDLKEAKALNSQRV